ncbi:uncharacterized protein JKF63_07938 [Porcisia hertigi]|uniref:MMS19 nucleotide excision repair protein n=1 Tax=Porcisia hertigi TaxID=2761500 RepID=A0A836HVE6_9TRYP|nr:hypothetical protein JKF63_07938 [Porcisia hertigi]
MAMEELISTAIAADGVAPDNVRDALRCHSLLSICEGMQEYLCAPEKVQPAMRLLASVAVDRGDLSKTDVGLLFSFFAEKLAQHNLQTTALNCLALLISSIKEQHACDEELFRNLSASFTRHVQVQQIPLNNRRSCFCIMSFLFTEKTLGLCDGDTLAVLLGLMDGESDPELVLQTFDLHVIVATCSTKEAFATVADDYFESISSYFPVVFSQPPGCKVTKADLRTHLKRCLCLDVYKELCIPFMHSKLSSPSTAVKEDILDVLLSCFDTYRWQDLVPHYQSLVLHMKSEVIKLSSFADRTANATLTKCVHMGCEILGRVSKQCSITTQSEALEIFGPVVEGFLAALTADPSTCSAYATMMFHVLTGAWNCCLFLSSYLFTMLSMTIDGAERPANAYLLLSVVASSMLDGLCVFPGESHKEQLRGSIERTTPLITEAVTCCSQRWRGSEDEKRVDDFTVMCGCEFIVSVLKLSALIEHWMPVAALSEGVDTIVWVALTRAEISTKVCRLLREYAAVDAMQAQEALGRLLSNPSAPAQEALAVTCDLASTSPAGLLLAFENGFLSPKCGWMGGISPEQRAASLNKTLQDFGNALQDDVADRMVALLSREDVSPEFFECAHRVAANLSGDTCAGLLSTEGSLSLFGIAAVVSSRTHLPRVQCNWTDTAAQLVDLTTADHQAWRRVGMEGVTGMLINKVYPEGTPALLTCNSPGRHLNMGIATLWGKLLEGCAGRGSATGPPPGVLVSSFLYEIFGEGAPALYCDCTAVQEAFSYVPFLATQIAACPSVLQLLLASGIGHSERPGPMLCAAIQCLVDTETEERIQGCLVDLLEVVRRLTSGGADGEYALARALLCSIDAKSGGNVALARFVLFNESSLRALLEGTTDAALAVRCRSLQLITSLARGAMSLMKSCSQEDKAELMRARDYILLVTKRSLGDHKRRVRQASAACRHEWFKVK